MRYLMPIMIFTVLLFTGCEEKKSEPVQSAPQESTKVSDETIKQVAQELKDKTSDVIDTAAKMAEELSQESKELAQEVKVESQKVIKKIAKESKEMTDVAVEKINEAKQDFDVTIEQVIEDEKNTKPRFFVNPSSSESSDTAAPTTQTESSDDSSSETLTDESSTESEATEETTEALSAEEDTQAENLYLKCAGCHGSKGERSALNKSAVIQGWDSQQIVDALQGYKAGTYGSVMKGLMQGQVANLTDEEIQLLADYIASFK